MKLCCRSLFSLTKLVRIFRMPILEAINKCRSLVCLGYTSTKLGGLRWLNDVCVEFKNVCLKLQTCCFKNNLSPKSSGFSTCQEECLLCISQIIKCIKYMEKTVKAEVSGGLVLSITRQHFLDRIVWCLETMSRSLDSLKTCSNMVVVSDSNFVDAMDIALDLVSPFTMFNDQGNDIQTNVAADQAEVLIESAKIRSAVNDLIGHALSFANIACPVDKMPLTTVCQTVLNECIAFEKIASLDQSKESDQSTRQIRATSLENVLYQLDGLMNDALLRLVFVVFKTIRTKPLDILSEMVECQDDGLDDHVRHFDEMADRLQQIGIFAAAFAPNQQAKNTIHSALASFESLEPVLIPSIISKSSLAHSDIFCRHWTDEMTTLQDTIQHIIDSNAFCSSFCDQLSQTISGLQRLYDRSDALAMISFCNVLQDHLRCNVNDLKLNETNTKRRLLYDNFELMVSECKAAVDACSSSESHRVVKRFRILLGVSKKFRDTLDRVDDLRQPNNAYFTFGCISMPKSRVDQIHSLNITRPSSSSLEPLEVTNKSHDAEEFFQSFGISRSTDRNILYATKKHEKHLTVSSQKFVPHRIQKKASLRSKLFKKLLPIAPQADSHELSSDTDTNQTMDLQITNILDQLTDLSTTLSNGL